MRTNKDMNKLFEIKQKFNFLEALFISIKYHLYLLSVLIIILAVYNILNILSLNEGFKLELLVPFLGGVVGVMLFYLIMCAYISSYIVKYNTILSIYSDRLEASTFRGIYKIYFATYKTSHKLQVRKQSISLLSTLDQGYWRTSRLITDSVLIYAPEGSTERKTIMKFLGYEDK